MRKLSWLLFFGLVLATSHATTARAETSIGADDGVGFGMLCPQPQQMVIGIGVLLEFEPGYGDAIKNLSIMCTSRDDAWNWAGGTEVRQKNSSPDKNKPVGPWMTCPQNTFISAVGVMRWVNAANQRVFAGLQLACSKPGQQAVTINPPFITDGTHAPSNFASTELRCLPNGNEQASFLSGIHGRYAAGQAQFGDAAVTKFGVYCLADAPSVGGGVVAVDPAAIDAKALKTLPDPGLDGAAPDAAQGALKPLQLKKFVSVRLDVDLYDAPGGGGQVLGMLGAGTKGVRLLGPCNDDWCHVAWPAGEGWVYSGPGYESLDLP